MKSGPVHTTTPNRSPTNRYSKEGIEQIVVSTRLGLYNHGLPCGPNALRVTLAEQLPRVPLPSERTIARILARNGLTHARTGWYPGESHRP